MPFQETVLLVEPGNVAVRTIAVSQRGVFRVLERLHLDPKDPAKVTIRCWENKDGEKDQTGQLRVFREVIAAPQKEEAEKPLFDETVIKEPLRFHADETPMGWRRKWLRKA